MIRYYTQIGKRVKEVNSISSAQWIDLTSPFEADELANLSNELQIPVDFITDSLDIDERSRYEKEDECKLILVNSPLLNEQSKENEAIYYTLPIGIIFVGDHILTVSAKENPILNKFKESKVKNMNILHRQWFALQIFEQNVFSFLECLKKLNLKRNLIEQELYNSSRNKELRQLLRIEKSLVYFVNSLSANELLKLKMKRTNFLEVRDVQECFDLFEDIIIDNGQALEMSNVYTNIISGTMEAYASIVSNNMNVFIHRLTIITIILMVPTLVASFYGMNLNHLPFIESRYAFYYIILFSVLLGFLLIWFFRRNKQL